MTHAGKVEAYKALMEAHGVAPSTVAPPLWQFCWSLGLEIPPPLFMGAPGLFLLTGTTFGVLFGAGAWILGNRGTRSMPLSKAGWVALVCGAGFGLVMAWYYRRLARKQHLGPWSAFAAVRVPGPA